MRVQAPRNKHPSPFESELKANRNAWTILRPWRADIRSTPLQVFRCHRRMDAATETINVRSPLSQARKFHLSSYSRNRGISQSRQKACRREARQNEHAPSCRGATPRASVLAHHHETPRPQSSQAPNIRSETAPHATRKASLLSSAYPSCALHPASYPPAPLIRAKQHS